MSNFILSAETVLPVSSKPLEDHAVAVSEGKIVDLGTPALLAKKHKNFKHVKLGKGILMPGFINAHIHLELGWIQPHIGNFSNFTEWLSQIITAKKNHKLSRQKCKADIMYKRGHVTSTLL